MAAPNLAKSIQIDVPLNPKDSAAAARRRPRRHVVLYALIAVCLAPIIASYYFYYVDPPAGRTNYGVLVQPQRPLPALTTTSQDGASIDLRALRGRLLMLMVDGADCQAACQEKLWLMRQIRAASGKDAERLERAFLVVKGGALDPNLVREYEGTHVLRADADELRQFLAVPAGGDLVDHIWLVDPLGNQMLRWDGELEPGRIKRDLERLLRASRIG